MDLSKLYLEGQPDSQKSIDVSRIVEGWINDSSAAIGEDAKSKFSNIKLVNTPYYLFRFNFQTIEREFYNGSAGYRHQTDIPEIADDSSASDFSFDDFSISDISFEDNLEENPIEKRFIIGPTQKVYRCSSCNGEGSKICGSCGGKGEERCSSCNGKGTKKCSSCENSCGWERCPSCYGEKGRYIGYNSDREWRECRTCYGKGEIRCRKCGGKGEIDCSKCKGSGIVKCNRCGGKGRVTCGHCDGAGKVVEFIAHSDIFSIESSIDMIQYNSAVPQNLKDMLRGDDDSFSDRLLSFTDGSTIIDSIDNPDDALKSLEVSKFSSLAVNYKSMKEKFEFSFVGTDENKTKKVLKSRTRVYQLDITHVTYDYEGNNYELWIYGKDNVIFNETNPFLIIANKNETEADELLKEKKYTYAISKLEKACQIAEASKNYDALCSFSEKLNDSRKKSNVEYLLGLLLGTFVTAVFYFIAKKTSLVYPSNEKLVTQGLGLPYPAVNKVLLGILNTILNYASPILLAASVFIKLVRDKLKEKRLRILVPGVLLLLYAIVRTFIFTKFAFAESDEFLAISIIPIIVAVIIYVAIKEPYKIVSSPYEEENASQENESSESEESDSDGSDDEESEYESVHVETISPKHRIIAMLLSFFLGFCGGHCFYVGKFWSGILRLAIFFAGSYFGSGTEEHPETAPHPVLGGILVGIACLWMLVDFILICAGKYKDKHGAVIKNW